MTLTTTLRDAFEVRHDRKAAALVALFTIVIAGSILLRPELVTRGVTSGVEGTSTGEQAAAGAGWAVLEAIGAAILIAIILAYRRLPDVLQKIVKLNVVLFLVYGVGALAIELDIFLHAYLFFAGLVTVFKLADHYEVYWVVNNILALGVAVYAGAYLGIWLSPWLLATGLIGLSVYDYWFADREDWMFTLGGGLVDARLPVLLILPRTLQYEWSQLTDTMDDEDEEEEPGIWFGIGTADLLLPAAFVVSLVEPAGIVSIGNVVVVTAIGGVLAACLRISRKLETEGGGAGLPPLTTGALAGWGVGAVVLLVV